MFNLNRRYPSETDYSAVYAQIPNYKERMTAGEIAADLRNHLFYSRTLDNKLGYAAATTITALACAAFCAGLGASLAGAFAGIELTGEAKLVGIIMGGLTGTALGVALPSGIVYYYRRNQKLTEEEKTSLENDIVIAIGGQLKDLEKSRAQHVKMSEEIGKKIDELNKLVPPLNNHQGDNNV